jgi:hypothetical protein
MRFLSSLLSSWFTFSHLAPESAGMTWKCCTLGYALKSETTSRIWLDAFPT